MRLEGVTTKLTDFFYAKKKTRFTSNQNFFMAPIKFLLVISCERVDHGDDRRLRTAANEIKI